MTYQKTMQGASEFKFEKIKGFNSIFFFSISANAK